MRTLEGAALWAAVAGYALAFAALSAGTFLGRERLGRAGWRLAAAGWAAHTLAIAVRWIATGHAPVQGAYENSLSGAWFIPLLGGVLVRQYRPAIRAAPFIVAIALLLLGNGIMAPAVHLPLEPPFRSNWLVVHVAFAWLAFGSYLVASVLAGYHLWLSRRRAAVPAARPAVIDELSAKLIAFGFVGDTVMIASGAIWAHGLWGRYWAWDPIETWSLVSWLTYAVYLHLRFTLGWTGSRAAWLALGAAAVVVVTFFGIGVVSDVHTQLL
ncbi:MAG TPA: cytochrome c biogenesis protein CcsA [Anaeromyxobacter sp.]